MDQPLLPLEMMQRGYQLGLPPVGAERRFGQFGLLGTKGSGVSGRGGLLFGRGVVDGPAGAGGGERGGGEIVRDRCRGGSPQGA